jgi:hypothetical protein
MSGEIRKQAAAAEPWLCHVPLRFYSCERFMAATPQRDMKKVLGLGGADTQDALQKPMAG